MPTVHRFSGLRVVIYPNDHRPAHVHVIGDGCEAVFRLGGTASAVELRENFGFGARALAQIAAEIRTVHAHLATQWKAIHDPRPGSH